MSRFAKRRPGASGSRSIPLIALAVLVAAAVIAEALWGFGLLDLSRFRTTEPSTAGLIPVPTLGRPVAAYTRITRDHVWDAKRTRLAVVYLPPRAVTPEMLRNLTDVIGRVVAHPKQP